LNTIRQTDRPIKEVNDLKLILKQLTRKENELLHTRNKRGVFNFIGGISKILFGTLDNEDANYYTHKITHLENEQLDVLKLSKEQISVVKTILRSVNSTLLSVSENEKFLSESLEEMAKHFNEQDGEIREMFTAYSLLLTINEHSIQLNRAIDECRREYEILEQVKVSQADMPSDLSLPIPTSAAYQHLLLRIISIDLFLRDYFLVYVIRLP
jgi:vacuolar-type H+-ATPase subunit I/STV1